MVILKYITVVIDNLSIEPKYTLVKDDKYIDVNFKTLKLYIDSIDNIEIVDNKIIYKDNVVKVIIITETQLKYPGHCIEGFNDLYTYCCKNDMQYLIKEFNDDKINIHNIAYSSNKKVNWKCSDCGHEWYATIGSRTYTKTMCPLCNSGKSTSINEQLLYLAIKNIHNDTANRVKINIEDKTFEIDILNNRINLLIDYRGAYSHKFDRAVNNDKILDELCKKHNINLIVIKEVEDGDSSIHDNFVIYNYKKDSKVILFSMLNQILTKQYGFYISFDSDMLHKAYINSLKGNTYNNINDAEWTNQINCNINKKIIPKHSHIKLTFKCEKGHIYETTPDKKSRGDGCPYCSGHRLLKGFNDMQTTHPIMSKDLDIEKSGFRADEVMATSHKRVYWKCQFCGYEWSHSLIKSRVAHGNVSKCPYCKTVINE